MGVSVFAIPVVDEEGIAEYGVSLGAADAASPFSASEGLLVVESADVAEALVGVPENRGIVSAAEGLTDPATVEIAGEFPSRVT